jgi:hypothetical protein
MSRRPLGDFCHARLLAAGAILLAAVVLLPATPVPVFAAKPVATKTTPETALHRIQRTVATLDAEASTPDGEARVLARLSAQLGASSDTLQTEHQEWGLGYGEIAMAYGFARSSRAHKTPAEVVAMRAQGTDWLVIAKQIGVKVDTVANRMNRHKGAPTKR